MLPTSGLPETPLRFCSARCRTPAPFVHVGNIRGTKCGNHFGLILVLGMPSHWTLEPVSNSLTKLLCRSSATASRAGPPQKTIAVELNALQRRMVSTILRIPQNSGETAAEYVKRRGQNAGRHCTQMGNWSSRWFKRAQDWNELAQSTEQAQLASTIATLQGCWMVCPAQPLFSSCGLQSWVLPCRPH